MTKIMDLHCDTISRIRSRRNEGHICGLQDNHFHVDLKRMKEAGYSLQTFALFTDAAEEESPFFASMELLDIFREEMKLAGLDRTTSQFFAVLTDLRSVGVRSLPVKIWRRTRRRESCPHCYPWRTAASAWDCRISWRNTARRGCA